MNTQNVLKKFRKANGLSQKDLGLKLGISPDAAQSRISHYESGRRDIPIELAYIFIDVASQSGDEISLEDVYPREEVA